MSKAKDLRDEIALLEGKLKAENPEKRTDLIEARFDDREKWVPPGYEHTDHFIWRKMPGSPDNYVNGHQYSIPPEELIHKYWKRV